MGFKLIALEKEQFEPLFEMGDQELKKHGAVRMVADDVSSFPCRVSLKAAQPGETVLLLNFEHLAVDSPYRSRHAIYVRHEGEQARLNRNEIPEMFFNKAIGVRAFDKAGMMQGCDIANGPELVELIEKMLVKENVTYLHLHWANAGCYAAKVIEA